MPRFETTSAAVYGRFVFAKRGLYKRWSRDLGMGRRITSERTFHQRSTSATSARKAVLSLNMILLRSWVVCWIQTNNDLRGYLRSAVSRCDLLFRESRTDACDIFPSRAFSGSRSFFLR